MTPYFDAVDGKWRIRGHESLTFSTEADAIAATYLAFDFSQELAMRELRYYKASQRGQAKQAELA